MTKGKGSSGGSRPTSSEAYHGTNSQGNNYTSGPYTSSGGGVNYHYSNSDGSYYYANSNGSTYYSDPAGRGHYSAPSSK